MPSIVRSSQSTAHQRYKSCFGSYAVRYHLGVRSTDNAVSTFIHVHVPAFTAARACPRVYSIFSSFFYRHLQERVLDVRLSGRGERSKVCLGAATSSQQGARDAPSPTMTSPLSSYLLFGAVNSENCVLDVRLGRQYERRGVLLCTQTNSQQGAM